ncbi:MAG: winged helix-turn-helix domain-containing protein [Planctomycetota bacterium]
MGVMNSTVSRQLKEKHGIEGRPGRKAECPFCHHRTFSIKGDDSVGKCFHPSCGKSITTTSRGGGGRYPRKTAATAQPSDGEGCTLAQYATAKGLPVGFLNKLGLTDIHYQSRPAVRIPYFDEGGNVVAVRFRIALEKSEQGDDRFRWKTGTKPYPYGPWRLKEAREKGFAVLVEGESDCHTLWYHYVPALGIPGATMWRDGWATYLDSIAVIYAVIEADSGGEAVMEWLSKSSIRDRVRLIVMNEAKDPSDLYLADPKGFSEAWQAAMDSAVPWAEREKIEAKARQEEAWEQCKSLAMELRILDRLAEDVARRGVAGEERVVKLIFLVLTSRLLDRPISIIIKGPSSGGKSYVVQVVLLFFPASAFYDLTGASEKAFAYSDEPLTHRMLVIYEAAGLNSDFGSYLIRSLLSEGRIRYETVEKTGNGLQPRVIEREGPTGLILTTTRTRIHPENETRALSLSITDTPEQTHRILLALAEERNEEIDFKPWHGLQQWIENGDRRVIIPYSRILANKIPPVALRLRRDFSALKGLICAHALLHQANRKRDSVGRVVATLDDYAVVRDLVLDVVSEGLAVGVSDTVRETVEAVVELRGDTDAEINNVQVARKLGLDKSTTQRRVRAAVDLGYLVNHEDKKGRPARLVPGDPLPEEIEVLPSVETLECCMVALKSEGIGTPPPSHDTGISDDAYEERAAIMEYEGAVARDEAERIAGQERGGPD